MGKACVYIGMAVKPVISFFGLLPDKAKIYLLKILVLDSHKAKEGGLKLVIETLNTKSD